MYSFRDNMVYRSIGNLHFGPKCKKMKKVAKEVIDFVTYLTIYRGAWIFGVIVAREWLESEGVRRNALRVKCPNSPLYEDRHEHRTKN